MKPLRGIREVRKRDNRIVPFDESKIADAIYAAFRSGGEGDRSLAAELAAAVTHFLVEKFPPSGSSPAAPASPIPGIEDIQDLVETILIEMGHAKAAKAYILYRQKRAMLRETLEVRKDREDDRDPARDDDDLAPGAGRNVPSGSQGVHRFPEVDQALQGISRWQKSRIAAALIREADLDPGVAGEIASSVEAKVLHSGIQRISTLLIRELVDNELFERGFRGKLLKQAPIAVPKYNLEQLIFGADTKEGYTFPKTPPEIREMIANHILHQYSLQEVFTPAVADAHREHRIFIHRLSDPIRLTRLRWRLPPPWAARAPASEGWTEERLPGSRARRFGEDAPGRPPAGSYIDFGDFLRHLSHLARFFSEEIRLSGLSNLLLDPASHAMHSAAKVREILERLTQMDARPDIALELDLEPGVLPWLEGLQEVSRARPGRFLIALRLSGESFAAGARPALEALSALYEARERIQFLPAGARTARAVPPWLRREPGMRESGMDREAADEIAIRRGALPGPRTDGRPGAAPFEAMGGKITINLPRAAFRSARDGRNSIRSELEEALDIAIKGHLERRRFIERLGSNRENPLWDLLGGGDAAPLLDLAGMKFSIGLLGLNEAVKYLTGHEMHQDPEAASLGIEIVRGILGKVRNEERSLGLRIILEETANVGPLRGLERADRLRHPQAVEVERGREARWGPAYTDGVRPHRMAPMDPLRRIEELAPYLRYVEPAGGIIEDLPELRGAAGGLLMALLEECVASPVVAALRGEMEEG